MVTHDSHYVLYNDDDDNNDINDYNDASSVAHTVKFQSGPNPSK